MPARLNQKKAMGKSARKRIQVICGIDIKSHVKCSGAANGGNEYWLSVDGATAGRQRPPGDTRSVGVRAIHRPPTGTQTLSTRCWICSGGSFIHLVHLQKATMKLRSAPTAPKASR